MKKIIAFLLIVSFLTTAAIVSAQQASPNSQGIKLEWVQCGTPQEPSAFPITVWVSPQTGPNLTYAQVSAAVDRAWQSWVDLPDSNITFVRVTNEAQARHGIYTSNDLGNGSSAVAETNCRSVWFFNQPTVLLASYNNWDTDPSNGIDPSKRSLDDVLRHEIGHVLGINHLCNATNSNLMCGSGAFNGTPPANFFGLNRPIEPDSQAAMAAFYPMQGAPTPTPTSIVPPTATPTPVNVYTCLVNATPVWSQTAPRMCP